MKNKSVLLGLSGGVDSAVAALILKKGGYTVTGAFIKSFSETKNKITGICSWRAEYKEAQKIASLLDIPLQLFDFEQEYRKHVIEPMLKAYKKGITPNPDITCNTLIKFPLLWKAARKIGINLIATGHHARIIRKRKVNELHQGKDKSKDQSYFLAELSQKDLAHTLFPIGEYTKETVRKIAEKNKFPNYDRQSSRGVCFIGNVPLKAFLEERIRPREGLVYNEEGTCIGKHQGAHYYTIGERVRPTIGISIEKGTSSQERFYIAKKNMRTNTITVVPEGHPLLNCSAFYLKKVHWINPHEKTKRASMKVRIRHLGPLFPATLELENNHWQFHTKKPLESVAPGQSAVFYKGTRLVCSGEITR